MALSFVLIPVSAQLFMDDPLPLAAVLGLASVFVGFCVGALSSKFFPGARRYLEVGCGNGAVLRAIAASRRWERLAGSELHPTGLSHARERLPRDVEFVQMDARHVPAMDVFDLTGAFDVIEH